MKLLIDRKARRVLFAEAGEDVVDFLVSLLDVPVGTALTLVGSESVFRGVRRLLASLDKLDCNNNVDQRRSGADKKDSCSSAADANADGDSSVIRLQGPSPELSRGFFRCHYNYSTCKRGSQSCCFYMTDARGTNCPNCGNHMTAPLHYISPAWYDDDRRKKARYMSSTGAATGQEELVAAATATYTVADNLTITPATTTSAMSSIALLNEFGVSDLAALEETTVRIGYTEGLKILEASLQSETILTDVFLGKERA